MNETTQLTDAEYRLYEKLITSGHSVKPDQIRTCRHCGKAYKVAFGIGASKNRCADESCRFAERAEQIKAEHNRKNASYREQRQVQNWKHDDRREKYRERNLLNIAAGFQYV